MSAYASRTTVREKLKLVVGQPVTIALEYSTGKRVPSVAGGADQFYCTLTDGRGWYADIEAYELIENLDLIEREPFTICKLGAGRFEVQRAGSFPTEPIRSGTRAGGRERAPENRQPLGETEAVNSQPQCAPISASVNGQGKTAAQILAACYAEAIGIALGASELARSKGLLVTPSFEDLRCDAAKLFIEQTGGRR